jgi:hypothetical protein
MPGLAGSKSQASASSPCENVRKAADAVNAHLGVASGDKKVHAHTT